MDVALFNQRGVKMAKLTGLYRRGSAYDMCVVLPKAHPVRIKYKNGKFVQSLGSCSHREAIYKGTAIRADVLSGRMTQPHHVRSNPPTPI